MATVNDQIVVDFLAGKDTVTPRMTQILNLGKGMGDLNSVGEDTTKMMKKLEIGLGKNNKEFDLISRQAQETEKKLSSLGRQFDMNSLSWLFGGMAMQRMGLAMTRFLIPSMEKLEMLNDEGAKKIMGVAAAWEFMKISMFEALMSLPLFDAFIKLIIEGAIWVAEFAQKHPMMVAILATIGAIMAVLGTMAIGIGLLMQWQHLGVLIGSALTGLGSITTMLAALTLPAALLLGLALLAGLSLLAALAFEESRQKLVDIWVGGGGGALQNLLDSIGDLLGLNLQLADVFKYLAAIGVWTWGVINLGLEPMIDSLTFVMDILNIIKDTLIIIASPDFSFSALGESLKAGFADLHSDATRMNEESTTLGEVLKGPVGLYKEMFSPETIANAESLTGAIDTQTVSMDTLGSELLENSSLWDSLTAKIDSWIPPDKHVNIYYNEIGGSGSSSSTSSSRSQVSSITT